MNALAIDRALRVLLPFWSITSSFFRRILRRTLRRSHNNVRHPQCSRLFSSHVHPSPNDAAAFHTILRMMQDCQFSAYGVMTKNLASLKSATLRDKWRLRRYLSPDGKVLLDLNLLRFVCNMLCPVSADVILLQTRVNDRFFI
jgi:hypothetical protein